MSEELSFLRKAVMEQVAESRKKQGPTPPEAAKRAWPVVTPRSGTVYRVYKVGGQPLLGRDQSGQMKSTGHSKRKNAARKRARAARKRNRY